jgi:hypothetical protein
MRIGTCPGPGHGERSEVGNAKSFRNMDSSHGRRTLDQQIGILARGPGCLEKTFDERPKLRPLVSARRKQR